MFTNDMIKTELIGAYYSNTKHRSHFPSRLRLELETYSDYDIPVTRRLPGIQHILLI